MSSQPWFMSTINLLDLKESNRRVVGVLAAILIGSGIITTLSFLLPVPEVGSERIYLSAILFDRASTLYPFTIQNLMWLMFSAGIAEVLLRFNRANSEIKQLNARLLPEDDASILRSKDLIPIYRRIKNSKRHQDHRLQRIILRAIQQFQISQSANQSNSLVNSSLELMQHEIDLRYNMLRYVVWLIPTLGFIGTVIGIALALSAANDMPSLDDSEAVQMWFGAMTTKLGLAFNTTFLALVMAAILVLLQHIAQGREESGLNGIGQYVLDHLINRLYEEKP